MLNPGFELGSVLMVHAAADTMSRGGDVLLMDADVLYHERIMTAPTAGQRPVNRVLIDREFQAGDEPVKVCVRDGVSIEQCKLLSPDLSYESIGESVGFFRLSEAGARQLASIVAGYADSGGRHMPHEEAVRDLLQERSQPFEVTDVTGSPWFQIDFPNDLLRAAHQVLPQL